MYFCADIQMQPPGHQTPPEPEMSIKVGLAFKNYA